MKKGLVFSVDALNGMVILLFVLGTFAFYYFSTGNVAVSGTVSHELTDAAIIGFYTYQNANDLGLDTSIQGGQNEPEFFECIHSKDFSLTAQTTGPTSQSGFSSEKKYCKGIAWKKE